MSAGQSRRSSTGDDFASSTIDLADSSSALHPCDYVVRRNTHFNRRGACAPRVLGYNQDVNSFHRALSRFTWPESDLIRARAKLEQSFAKHLAFRDGVERLPVFFQRICGVDMNA